MANTTTTQVSSAVNNFYDRVMLMRAVPAFVHTRWAQVRDIPKKSSEVIKFRRYGSLSAATTALTEGLTPNGSQLSVTDVTATVALYGDFVTLTDFLQMTTLDPLITEASEVLGEQAGNSLDQICRNVIRAGTTVQYASTSTTRLTVAAGMILNGDEVREAVRTLDGNDAKRVTSQVNPSSGYNTSPIAPAYIGVITENSEYDLKADPDFVSVEEYSSSIAPLENEIGKLDKVRFIMSTNGSIFAAGGAGSIDVHGTLIIGKEAYGISRISGEALRTIVKPLGSAGSEDPLDQRSTVGWKASFVAVILNESFLLRIEHAVSA